MRGKMINTCARVGTRGEEVRSRRTRQSFSCNRRRPRDVGSTHPEHSLFDCSFEPPVRSDRLGARSKSLRLSLDDPACCLDATQTGLACRLPTTTRSVRQPGTVLDRRDREIPKRGVLAFRSRSLDRPNPRRTGDRTSARDTPVPRPRDDGSSRRVGRRRSDSAGARPVRSWCAPVERDDRYHVFRGVVHFPCGVFVSKCFQLRYSHCVAMTNASVDYFDQRSRAHLLRPVMSLGA